MKITKKEKTYISIKSEVFTERYIESDKLYVTKKIQWNDLQEGIEKPIYRSVTKGLQYINERFEHINGN